MTLLELRQISVEFEDQARPVLTEVELSIDEGELTVVLGPTGSGKSTLLGVVSGLVPSFTGGRLSGDLLWQGESILTLPARERAGLIGFVGQDPAWGFVTDTVEEELAYGMEQLGLAPATMRRRVEETLDLLGIADLRARDLRTLSGGQQQRVAIGAVLGMHPRLLVLDEPTSALDPTAAEEVLATLTRLVHDLGVSVLVAEHRLERVLPFADSAALVTGTGQVIAGETDIVLAQARLVPPIIELGRLAGWEPPPLTVRDARRRATSWRARLPEDPPHAHPDGAVSAGAVPAQDAPRRTAAEMDHVTVRRGQTVALKDVSWSVPAGRVTALMGRNGAGKSTLLRALHQGLDAHSHGRLGIAGEDPAGWTDAVRRQRIGLVPQSFADLLYLDRVDRECAATDRAFGVADGTCWELVADLVPGVSPASHPRDLSEGQRLGLVLGIVLTGRPELVLLDEPTRGLDYAAKRSLRDRLRMLTESGRTVVVATHDVEFVADAADEVVVLAEGELVSAGPMAEVVAQSPAFAPQVTKILGPGWVSVDQVARLEVR